MEMNRREFLGYTAGALSVAGVPITGISAVTTTPRSRMDRWRVITQLPQDSDDESLRGYQAALPTERQRVIPGEGCSPAFCSLIVVPSVFWLKRGFARNLNAALRRGSTVIVETGAGFAPHLAFCHHRRALRDLLNIRAAAPVDIWASPRSSPYIEFTWPRRAKVRDFSRVVPPVDRPGDDVIAWAGDLAVAFRRRVGKGTLIYLGSPVGPALWAGDVEARRWLYAVALAA